MATADEYAQWIVSNADKKGTPEFDVVSKAYQDAKLNVKPQQVSFNPAQMLINAPASLYRNTIGGLIEAASSPLQTATALTDIAAGGLQNITPKPLRDLINQANVGGPFLDPAASQRSQNIANLVGQDYAKTYGTGQGFARTMEEDPFRVAGDVSMLLGGGSAAARAANFGKVGNALAQASAVTNPMNALLRPAAAVISPTISGFDERRRCANCWSNFGWRIQTCRRRIVKRSNYW